MRQLAQAIGLVRQHAEQWNILPDKIALCGFSAGGHLALSGAVWEIPGMADQPRPNALLLAYPVVTAGEYAHRDSFVQLTGTQDVAAHQRFTLEDKITPATPPVFVWHTMEDETVPVLKSAIANAENNFNMDKKNLYVAECFVCPGPMLKRIRPRAQGRAFRVMKRTSHVTMVLREKE